MAGVTDSFAFAEFRGVGSGERGRTNPNQGERIRTNPNECGRVRTNLSHLPFWQAQPTELRRNWFPRPCPCTMAAVPPHRGAAVTDPFATSRAAMRDEYYGKLFLL